MMDYKKRREFNIQIFNETKDLINQSTALQEAVQNTKDKTKIYRADEEIALPAIRYSGEDLPVEVSKRRSFEAAGRLLRLYPGSRIGVLNFASATNPGGGVKSGSNAQEEGLCRCSTLYPCLWRKSLRPEFYDYHRAKADALYSDTCIYTPDVVVLRSDSSSAEVLPEKEWYKVDVISCAAPNLREHPGNAMNPDPSKAVKISADELLKIHMNRGRKILCVAAANNIDTMVLGAFGCGAFQNDPHVVSDAYRRILPKFKGYFRRIEFAVYCKPSETANYDVFEKILG